MPRMAAAKITLPADVCKFFYRAFPLHALHPSPFANAGFMAEIADRAFNHDHAGITALQPPLNAPPSPPVVPKDFRVNARRQLLGTGKKAREFTTFICTARRLASLALE